MDRLLEKNPLKKFTDQFEGISFIQVEEESKNVNSSSKKPIVINKIDFNDEMDRDEIIEEMKRDERILLPKNFKCPVKYCTKVYTSFHGLRYHMDHGHTPSKVVEKRPYVCRIEGCNKAYKNNNGLKYHIMHAHRDLNDEEKSKML